jgi:hypothetical protein
MAGEIKRLYFADGVDVTAGVPDPLSGQVIADYLDFTHIATPATPSAATLRVYAKADNNLYAKTPAGVEIPIGSGSGGGSGEKNYITNPSAAAAITGWNVVGDLTVNRATVAAVLPREFTTGTGIEILATSGVQSTADYVYFDFTLDDVDLNKKLKIQWAQRPSAAYVDGQLAVVITTQADRTTAIATPDVTSIGNYTGVFSASFDTASTATLSLVIRATTDMTDSHGVVISDVIVGPGTITPAMPWGYMGTFTPVFTGVTVTVVKAVYYRAGDRIKIDCEVTAATDATGNVVFLHSGSISGVTLDTSKYGLRAAIGFATANIGSNSYSMIAKIDGSDTTFSLYNEAGSLNATLPAGGGGFDSGDRLSFQLEYYVSEWAGAVNYAGSNDVEYASVGGTWNADSSTTVYGPGGSLMGGALTGARLKTLTWQTNVQATDRIIIWGSEDQVNWFPIIGARLGTTGYVVNFINDAGDIISGVQWLKGASANQTIIRFAQYMAIAADGSPATDWPSSLAYWVVTKTREGSATGFGIARDGLSGLISYYKESSSTSTFTFNGSGGTSAAATIYLTRIGRQVNLIIEASVTATTGTGSTTFISNTAIASEFRPTVAKSGSCIVRNNGGGLTTPGFYTISTAGIITVQRDISATAWTNSAPDSGIQSVFEASYRI